METENKDHEHTEVSKEKQFLIGKQGSDKILLLLTQGEPKTTITNFQNENGLLDENDMYFSKLFSFSQC